MPGASCWVYEPGWITISRIYYDNIIIRKSSRHFSNCSLSEQKSRVLCSDVKILCLYFNGETSCFLNFISEFSMKINASRNCISLFCIFSILNFSRWSKLLILLKLSSVDFFSHIDYEALSLLFAIFSLHNSTHVSLRSTKEIVFWSGGPLFTLCHFSLIFQFCPHKHLIWGPTSHFMPFVTYISVLPTHYLIWGPTHHFMPFLRSELEAPLSSTK